MVLVSRERQCLGGSALSMMVIPSDNKAEHINITIAKTHNITNWPIQWVIGQFDEIGQLGCSLHTDWPIWRIGQFDVTDHCLVPPSTARYSAVNLYSFFTLTSASASSSSLTTASCPFSAARY